MSLQSIEISAGSSRIASERAGRSCILTINGGSSSLKFGLFATDVRPKRLLSGRIERIGMPGVPAGDGRRRWPRRAEESAVAVPDQTAAVGMLIELIGHLAGLNNIAVVGHRVVHGGNPCRWRMGAAGALPCRNFFARWTPTYWRVANYLSVGQIYLLW